MGVSMGGQTGIWLAGNHPERLHGAVLCNTGMKIGTADGWNQRIETVLDAGLDPIAEQVAGGWITGGLRAADEQLWQRLLSMLRAVDPASYAAACAAVRDADLREDAARVTVPTLVVVGDEDVPTPPAMGRELQATIQGAALVELHAAHVSPLEQPVGFAAAVREFIKEKQ